MFSEECQKRTKVKQTERLGKREEMRGGVFGKYERTSKNREKRERRRKSQEQNKQKCEGNRYGAKFMLKVNKVNMFYK